MTDPHDPYTSAGPDVAAQLAIPGGRQPLICRVAATGDGSLPPLLARLLLDTYTAVGDIDDVAFAAAAGRHHHALAGERHLATLGHAAGYIDLILLHWPRPASDPRLLILACRALRRNAGVLVIAVSVEPDQRIGQLSALSGAATSAGLRLIDHITAIDPTSQPATPLAELLPSTEPAEQLPVPHTDLLVFSPLRSAR